MNPSLEYDFVASAFMRMTGVMAPGKSDPSNGPTFEERQALWEDWNKENEEIIRAFVKSANYFFGDEN